VYYQVPYARDANILNKRPNHTVTNATTSLGAVHKICPQFGHFLDKEGGGSSDADVRTIGAKNFGFFNNYGVSARQDEEKGSIFRHFVQTSFVDRPLLHSHKKWP